MKIEGIGNVSKATMMEILTEDGRKSVKSGDISLSDLAGMYKLELAKKESSIGKYPDTFRSNFERIPSGLFDKLSPAEIASLVDAFYKCYGDGKSAN